MTKTVRGVPRARSATPSGSSSTPTTSRRRSPSSGRSPASSARPLRNTANPTMLDAGYKANVIPGTAHAVVDGRFLPGLRGGVRARSSTRCSARTSTRE
ncbi:MAG: peptidase dimerization domain-containing protein [Candidatus Limnocylindrales bacterium]